MLRTDFLFFLNLIYFLHGYNLTILMKEKKNEGKKTMTTTSFCYVVKFLCDKHFRCYCNVKKTNKFCGPSVTLCNALKTTMKRLSIYRLSRERENREGNKPTAYFFFDHIKTDVFYLIVTTNRLNSIICMNNASNSYFKKKKHMFCFFPRAFSVSLTFSVRV